MGLGPPSPCLFCQRGGPRPPLQAGRTCRGRRLLWNCSLRCGWSAGGCGTYKPTIIPRCGDKTKKQIRVPRPSGNAHNCMNAFEEDLLELTKLDYQSPQSREHESLLNPKTVFITRLLIFFLMAVAGFYLFILLGWGGGVVWLGIIAALGWLGLFSTIVAFFRLNAYEAKGIVWLNVGILLLWGRFWLELFFLVNYVVVERGSVFSFDEAAIWIPIVLLALLTGVTVMTIKLDTIVWKYRR